MKFEHLSELQAALLEKQKVIDLTGRVDVGMASRFKESMEYLSSIGCPDAEINFCSCGGKTSLGFDIYYLIRDYPGRVVGRVIGECLSSATTILQGCDHRIAYPSGTLLVHHTSNEKLHAGLFRKDGTPTVRGREKILELLEVEEQKIKILLTRMTISRSELLKLLNKNKTIKATEALELGLIDEVRDPCRKPFEPKK